MPLPTYDKYRGLLGRGTTLCLVTSTYKGKVYREQIFYNGENRTKKATTYFAYNSLKRVTKIGQRREIDEFQWMHGL